MSFWLRLALGSALAVAAAVAAVSVVTYVVVGDQLRGQVEDSLRERADQIVRGPALAVVPGRDGDLVLRYARGRGLPTPDVYLQAVASDGSVARTEDGVALPVEPETREAARGEREAFFSDADVDGVHVRMLTVPVENGFALQVVRPLTEVDDSLAQLRTILVVVSLAGIVAAALIGALIAGAALGPVRRLTREAETVARTQDLGHRIDVSGRDELSRLAASFHTMLAALANSHGAQRQLVADASHELRTPLTSLRTNIELLGRGDELPAERREQMLRDVALQLEEMSSLVTGLVELAADAPLDLEHTEIRLDELTEEAVTRARRLAPQLAFRTDLRPTTIRGVPTRVQRAIVNVLDNAVKWSPPGGSVDVAVADGAVAIRDRGPGIAQDDLPHVFDHFYRAPAARSLPGSGLGLSIVRQVVQQPQGSASIEAADGGGTLVRLAFPVVSNGAGPGAG